MLRHSLSRRKHMQEPSVVSLIFVIWFMFTGLALIVRGPSGAVAVNRWAFQQIFRLIGGSLIWLGNQIRRML